MTTKEIAVEVVRKWIQSSLTHEQLDCCFFFIQDTLYMRFKADAEVTELKLLITEKRAMLDSK